MVKVPQLFILKTEWSVNLSQNNSKVWWELNIKTYGRFTFGLLEARSYVLLRNMYTSNLWLNFTDSVAHAFLWWSFVAPGSVIPG